MSSFAGYWVQDNTGWWYQYDNGGYPASSWLQDSNGKWYYFNSDGYMVTGWIQSEGHWYYLESSGEMRTDVLIANSLVYEFDSSGKCLNPSEKPVSEMPSQSTSVTSGWVPYSTSSLSTLTSAISKGYVVYHEGQYWASPEYVNMLKNEQIVYMNDISANYVPQDRYSLANIDLSQYQ